MSKDYNGWYNYETWRVMLECFDGYVPESIVDAEWCEKYVEELLTGDSLCMPYTKAFLSDVDWREIASAVNEELVNQTIQDDAIETAIGIRKI